MNPKYAARWQEYLKNLERENRATYTAAMPGRDCPCCGVPMAVVDVTGGHAPYYTIIQRYKCTNELCTARSLLLSEDMSAVEIDRRVLIAQQRNDNKPSLFREVVWHVQMLREKKEVQA